DRRCIVPVEADLIEVIVVVTLAVGAGEWAAVERARVAAVAHAVMVVAIAYAEVTMVAHTEVVVIVDAVVLSVVNAAVEVLDAVIAVDAVVEAPDGCQGRYC
ncbi:hypothetical protein F5887DRAFT_951796, partial [Amanita rubescens]